MPYQMIPLAKWLRQRSAASFASGAGSAEEALCSGARLIMSFSMISVWLPGQCPLRDQVAAAPYPSLLHNADPAAGKDERLA